MEQLNFTGFLILIITTVTKMTLIFPPFAERMYQSPIDGCTIVSLVGVQHVKTKRNKNVAMKAITHIIEILPIATG